MYSGTKGSHVSLDLIQHDTPCVVCLNFSFCVHIFVLFIGVFSLPALAC